MNDIKKPCHCYGKMDWILKYPIDKIPQHSICNCAYVKSCLKITKEKRVEVK